MSDLGHSLDGVVQFCLSAYFRFAPKADLGSSQLGVRRRGDFRKPVQRLLSAQGARRGRAISGVRAR